ncbi:hypothetical protein [Paenibacillus alkalitolerans]|uniref:hypothetical protein n=1 Tax=Paenibacillus alkalitolerans TaxID=2799335 RepID=UPI0018F390EA|nr:hypothetical protein [Paenibacillus alkalitolerans]
MSDFDRIDRLEQNFKEEINELKAEQKEQRRLITETITAMKENLIELKILTKNHSDRLDKQDQRLEKMGEDITALKVNTQQNNQPQDNDQWFKKMLEGNWRILWVVLLVALSVAFGVKVGELLKVMP